VAKISPVKPNELIKFLHSKGFQPHKNSKGKGSHVVLYNPETKKWTTVKTSKNEIRVGLLLTILAEAGITREEFMNES